MGITNSNKQISVDRIDCEGALKVTLALTAAPDIAENITELVLDFSDLEYISSAGLRVLLAAQKRFAQTGGVMILDPNETVMEVFEMTGFADILTIERKAG